MSIWAYQIFLYCLVPIIWLAFSKLRLMYGLLSIKNGAGRIWTVIILLLYLLPIWIGGRENLEKTRWSSRLLFFFLCSQFSSFILLLLLALVSIRSTSDMHIPSTLCNDETENRNNDRMKYYQLNRIRAVRNVKSGNVKQ